MENLGEAIWFLAYLMQMLGLLAGVILVTVTLAATLYELISRRVAEGQMQVPAGNLKQAETA